MRKMKKQRKFAEEEDASDSQRETEARDHVSLERLRGQFRVPHGSPGFNLVEITAVSLKLKFFLLCMEPMGFL